MSDEQPATLKARIDALTKDHHRLYETVQGMDNKLDRLVEAEAERRGREQRDERRHADKHDDRIQVWMRHLIPAGVLGGLWVAFWTWLSGGQQ